jgi:tRNA1Val (adenine37-N6)-methyltransferase
MSQPFRFKQFQVHDHLSTMKVGTDAILLGAWCRPPQTGHILDVGTGCGIIALMLAQKSDATITAIDIHEPSVIQANENFRNSPWQRRLNAERSSLEEFAMKHQQGYDFIVSNPPFFINSLKPKQQERLLARHTQPDFIDVFLRSVATLLKPVGRATFIIPMQASKSIEEKIATTGLNLIRTATVQSKPGAMTTRILVEVGKTNFGSLQDDSIFIMDQNNQYTKQFQALTKNYYLFMV